jgi:hypothetical protein
MPYPRLGGVSQTGLPSFGNAAKTKESKQALVGSPRKARLERDQEKWVPVFLQNRATSKKSRAATEPW